MILFVYIFIDNYTKYFSNDADMKILRKRQLGFSNGSKLSSRAHDLLSSVERKN